MAGTLRHGLTYEQQPISRGKVVVLTLRSDELINWYREEGDLAGNWLRAVGSMTPVIDESSFFPTWAVCRVNYSINVSFCLEWTCNDRCVCVVSTREGIVYRRGLLGQAANTPTTLEIFPRRYLQEFSFLTSFDVVRQRY